MSVLSAQTPSWQTLWARAREARDSGATNRALAFFGRTLAATPPAAAPYAEAADFAVHLEHGLAPLEELYARHRAAFDLSPGDMAFRPQDIPLNGDGLRRALDWLEIAANLDPVDTSVLQRRAEILEELGRLDDALACRRHIARHFGPVEGNGWAIAILLERTGATSDALSYGEGLLCALIEPVPALCLARVYEKVGRHEDSRLLGQLLARTMAQENAAASTTHFRFAWSATNYGLPGAAKWPRALLLRTIERAKQSDTSIEAQLAAGLAACLLDDEPSSKKYFAAACWKAHGQFGIGRSPTAPQELYRALNYAARKLLDFSVSDKAYDGPSVATRHLLLVCAHYLREDNDVIEALARFDNAFGAISGPFKDQPFESQQPNTYRGYRIVARDGIYYAIPLGVVTYKILLGSVYPIPTNARAITESCPTWLKHVLRAALAWHRPWKLGAGAANAAQSVRRRRKIPVLIVLGIFAKALTPFAIRGVLKTNELSALYTQIDAALRLRQQLE